MLATEERWVAVDERDRRHKREFEPPPWEQEAFERFEKERGEREAEAALEAALISARRVTAAPTAEPSAEVEEEPDAHAAVPAEVAEQSTPQAPVDAVSAARVETMLMSLKNEEPVAIKSYTIVANTVSVLLVVGGVGFVVWSAVLFARVGSGQGPTATLASMLLMVWGFLLMGGAVLLFRKYNV